MSALDLGLVVVFACVAWWASTGLILLLIGGPERTYRWSMLGGVLAALAGLAAVVATSGVTTRESAIVAFLAAIALWGVVEMAFLMGYVVGPRREACPPRTPGALRFRFAATALAYHELALAAVLVLLAWLVRGEPNQTALHLFALLWVMRLSTKLNIFLGVCNASESFLPRRIAYLASYFRKAPMNPLFPLSITLSTAAVVGLALASLQPGASAHTATSAVLLATFAALAVIEHWLLVLPLPTMALWPWAHPSTDDAPPLPRIETATLTSEPAAPSLVVPAIAGKR